MEKHFPSSSSASIGQCMLLPIFITNHKFPIIIAIMIVIENLFPMDALSVSRRRKWRVKKGKGGGV